MCGISNICVKFHKENIFGSQGYLVILKGYEDTITINYFIYSSLIILKINHTYYFIHQGAREHSEDKYLSNVEKPEGRPGYSYIEMSAREFH